MTDATPTEKPAVPAAPVTPETPGTPVADPTAPAQVSLTPAPGTVPTDPAIVTDEEVETLPGPNGEEIEVITVTENIIRRGQVAFTSGDKVHAAAARELGINPDGTDNGEQANAAQPNPGPLPSAGAEFGTHPDALVDAKDNANRVAGIPVSAAPSEDAPEGVPTPTPDPGATTAKNPTESSAPKRI